MNKKPAPSPAERWIDCGHNECRSRSNAASGWPCMFAGKYETSVGPVGSPSPAERCATCGGSGDWDTVSPRCVECGGGGIAPQPEAASECPAVWDTTEGALRCDLSAGHGDWHRPSENVMRELLAHDAALRAALKKAEEAIERLYFAANWHPDRTVDADALWSAIRDAAGITPGQTASRVGPDRGCEQRDAAEARVLSLEAERASWKTAAEDQNTWLAAHNRAVAAFNVAIGDAQDAEARAVTLGKVLRDLISAWQNYPGCYDESPEPDKEIEALCKEAAAVLEATK